MVMMEAMCAGCAVPNTGSGGAIELSDRVARLSFPGGSFRAQPGTVPRSSRTGNAWPRLRYVVSRRGGGLRIIGFKMMERTCEVFTQGCQGPCAPRCPITRRQPRRVAAGGSPRIGRDRGDQSTLGPRSGVPLHAK